MSRREHFPGNLPHPIFLLSLVLLVVNDFVLKQQFPGLLTGKLSDVAGLFAFAFFWSALWPHRTSLVLMVTAAGFVFWNSPLSTGVIDAWNGLGLFSAGRTVDRWDNLALLVLPLVPLARLRTRPLAWRPVATSVLLVVSMAAFIGTSQRQTWVSYEQTAPEYQFNCTKAHFLRTLYGEGIMMDDLPEEDTPLVEPFTVCPGIEAWVCAEIEVAETGGRTLVWLVKIKALEPMDLTPDELRQDFETRVIAVVREELNLR